MREPKRKIRVWLQDGSEEQQLFRVAVLSRDAK